MDRSPYVLLLHRNPTAEVGRVAAHAFRASWPGMGIGCLFRTTTTLRRAHAGISHRRGLAGFPADSQTRDPIARERFPVISYAHRFPSFEQAHNRFFGETEIGHARDDQSQSENSISGV